MALATFNGIDINALISAAGAQPVGSQKAKFSADVSASLGVNPVFEIIVGSLVVYRTTISGSLAANATGVALPSQLTEPPSVNTANTLAGATGKIRLRNSANSGVYIDVPVIVGGNADSLTASKALDGIQPVRLSGVLLTPPTTLDVGGTTPPPAPTSSWLQTALSDMRKDGTFTYMNSYASNDARPYLREMTSSSSQSTRANLVMGRYPNPTAFTTTNPDYQTELSYVASGAPERSHANWTGLMWWAQVFLSEDYASNTSKHDVGFQQNTRVMFWDCQVWIKWTNGTWERMIFTDSPSGEAWYPDFRSGQTSSPPGYDFKVDVNGYSSFRTTPITGTDGDGLYRVAHPYGGLRSWSAEDVEEVVASCKTALVKHNASGPDDRNSSRFLVAVGADYYPTPTPGELPYYYGIGTSRHKYVTALYPAFQFHVMHTASRESLTLSYPEVVSTTPPPVTPPPPTSAAALILDSGNFASTGITSNVGTGNRDRYLTGGDFDDLLFATSQTYSWWELSIVGSTPTNATDYAETSFKSVMGPDGSTRRVISLNIKQDSPGTTVEQIRITDYQVAGVPSETRTEPVFHQRMWVKFDQNELARAQRVGATNYYHIFWEVKAEPDYRFRIQLQYDGTLDRLYWVAHDDVLTNATRIHQGENKSVSVVLAPHSSAAGWHLIEVLFDRPAGKWRCTVDGSNIINWSGSATSLMGASGNIANFPMFMQNYSAVSMGTGFEGNMEVLFSDFKLWDKSPSDAWQAPDVSTPPPAPVAWEPDDDAGLLSWFDMSTPSSLNTTAKTWTARYGVHTLVSTSGSGPSKITNGFSSGDKGAAVFTWSSDTDLKIVNPGFQEITFVAVLRFTTVGSGVIPTIWTRAGGLGTAGLATWDFGGFSVKYRGGGNAAEAFEPSWPAEVIVVSRHTTSSRVLRINGVQVASDSTTQTGTAPTSTEDFLLFPYPGSAASMTVQVAAIGLFTGSSWSTGQAQMIEGFAAHGGLGVSPSILPSDHPYRSTPPGVTAQSFFRLTESDDVRITEAGDHRILELIDG